MISHFNRFLCKEIEMADRVRFMRIKKACESGDPEVGEKCFAVCAVRMRLVPVDVVPVPKDRLGRPGDECDACHGGLMRRLARAISYCG